MQRDSAHTVTVSVSDAQGSPVLVFQFDAMQQDLCAPGMATLGMDAVIDFLSKRKAEV